MSTEAEKPFWMLKLPTSIQGHYCWAKWIDNPSSFVREAHEEILQVIEYSAVEELKADMQKLVEALEKVKTGCPTQAKGCTCVRDTAWIALEQHKAKYGEIK